MKVFTGGLALFSWIVAINLFVTNYTWAQDEKNVTGPSSPVQFSCQNIQYEIFGLQRTDEQWFRDYLDLSRVLIQDSDDIEALQKKIMTTDIFTAASVKVEPSVRGSCKSQIFVNEKWTRIPVIRGAYGGGTPLVILGGYETNAFGRLFAIGGEIRRYGNQPPGAFLFFKSPRAWRGLGLWGGEIWLDRRRRQFYDRNGDVFGFADSESLLTKMQWLYPIGRMGRHGSFQAGFHLQVSRESPSSFAKSQVSKTSSYEHPRGVSLNTKAGFGGVLGAIIAGDDLTIYGLSMDGLKGRLVAGTSRAPQSTGAFSEAEVFGYALAGRDVNLAVHAFIGSTTDKTLSGLYYLGGFDSIRGLPDGIRYGNKIAYTNLELRAVAARFQYAHIQPAVFIDSGAAWLDSEPTGSGRETSTGAGFRISIPQVYRLILRVDYGLSIGTTKSRGVSIGLNQFFQPYKLTF